MFTHAIIVLWMFAGFSFAQKTTYDLFFTIALNEINRGNKHHKVVYFLCGMAYGLVCSYAWPLIALYLHFRPYVVKAIMIYQLKQAIQREACRVEV